MYNEFYLIKNYVLFKHIVDNGHGFEARVIPDSLVDVMLHLGHNQCRHNGYQRTNATIKCLYYWKGMKMQILQYSKCCKVYAQQKVQKLNLKSRSLSLEYNLWNSSVWIWLVNFTHHQQKVICIH